MSQKEDENDYSYKNFQPQNSSNSSMNQQTQQQQQQVSHKTEQQSHIPIQPPLPPASQFMPPPPPSQMPPYYQWDPYYHYYSTMSNPSTIPTQFDPNQMYPKISTSLLTPSSSSKLATTTTNNNSKTTSQIAATSMPTPGAPTPQSSHYMPPTMPYMDPFMYNYMAHALYGYNAYQHGMPPSFMPPPPFGLGHHGSSASISGGQHQLQEDQLSLRSYHMNDIDTRSEKRLNLNSSLRQPQNLSSNFKQEPHDQRNLINRSGLLIEDPTNLQTNQGNNNDTLNLDPTITNSLAESSMIKRDDMYRSPTPQLHTKAHVRASFALNCIVQIRANEPCEGQPALVDIVNVADLMEHYVSNSMKALKDKTILEDADDENDEDDTSNEIRNQTVTNYKLVQEFPGPLIREYTSKAQVIQFCQKNVKQCLLNTNLIDPQSHALLWDFLALLVRQNGLIDLKTDISPLLLTGIGAEPLQQSQQQQTTLALPKPKQLSNSPSSSSLVGLQQSSQDFVLVSNDGAALNNVIDSTTSASVSSQTTVLTAPTTQTKAQTEEEVNLNKLRQLLGAGQKSDAIELAIKLNMWPHALFLASYSNTNQLDSKMLNKVKLRFINSLPVNDPIQTCYQLLSGRIPTVANNISKLDWNDWRRHLAMIVSNIDETNKDLVLNTIKTMGDSLASNGRVAASHFCYLLANCPFGNYEKKASKLVLIGSSHNQDFIKFCQLNAIQATEIYEFANSLSSTSNFGMLDHFVKYKLIYTTRLLEFGLINEASKYIEVISKSINSNPKVHSSKISTVFQLANRLKIYHSDFVIDELNNTNNEPQWLQELSNNYKKLHLNKLWYLLPAEPEVQQQQNQQQQLEVSQQNQQQQQYQYQDQLYQTHNQQTENDNNINILTKNEPKTAEPSPVNQQNTSYYDPQYQQQQQQYQYDIPDLSQDMNKLNLQIENTDAQPQLSQQTVPFYPTYSSNDNTNLTFTDQQQQQPAQINQRRFEVETQNQLYDPSNQQQQQYQVQQPQLFNPTQQDYNVNSSNQSQSYLDSKQQTFNYNSNTIYNPLAQPSTTLGSTTQPTGRRSSNASVAGYTSNRSRQSSTSTSNEPQHNLYQPQQYHNQSLFDPSATSHMTRSVTYPINHNNNNQTESNQMSSHLSSNPIKEEPTNVSSSKQKDDSDDEDLRKDKKDAKNPSQPNQDSEGWLSRLVKTIRPANTAKRMVLPDDKKKSIVWDEKLGRYINKEAGEDQVAAIKPPPTFAPKPAAATVAPTLTTSNVPQENTQPSTSIQADQKSTSMAPPTIGNQYSIKSAGGNRRNAYYSRIDVMASQSKKVTPDIDQQLKPLLSTMPPPSQLPPKLFVPEPGNTSSLTQPSEPQQQQDQQSQDQTQTQSQQQYEYQTNTSDQYQQQSQVYQQQNYMPSQTSSYQNSEQQNVDYYYQQQQQKQQYQQSQLMPTNYQENYTTEESSDSATNSHESYNGSSQTSSSNDSNYIQQQQQQYYPQQYGYQYYDNNNHHQFYDPNQHSNI